MSSLGRAVRRASQAFARLRFEANYWIAGFRDVDHQVPPYSDCPAACPCRSIPPAPGDDD